MSEFYYVKESHRFRNPDGECIGRFRTRDQAIDHMLSEALSPRMDDEERRRKLAEFAEFGSIENGPYFYTVSE